MSLKVIYLKELSKKIFYSYILFNFHVAFSVVALYLLFNDSVNYDYLFLLYFSTVFSYSSIRLLSFKDNRFFIKKFFIRHKNVLFSILFISALLSFVFYSRVNINAQILLVPLVLITGLYNFEYQQIPKLRDFGLIKILIVAFVWTGIIIVIPVNLDFTYESLLKALFIFFYVMLLTLAFDQRDIYIDQKNIKTIPQLYYPKLIYIYLILFLVLSFLNYALFKNSIFLINELIIVISGFMCLKSGIKNSFFYTTFWIEGLPVFWLLLRFGLIKA